jgi:6-pyruvoyltetrahydropterin/6-carboxytetrahydropterin synthase
MNGPQDKILYGCTKTFTHSVGLSCVFRQWRAESHCNQLHGYAIQVTLDFATYATDHNGWVVDFGGMKSIKEWLLGTFDHALIIAESDPKREVLEILRSQQLARIVYIPEVGCENFARYIMEYVDDWLKLYASDVRLRKVTVAEHEGNSAYVERRVL